jgi:hypothetical protein
MDTAINKELRSLIMRLHQYQRDYVYTARSIQAASHHIPNGWVCDAAHVAEKAMDSADITAHQFEEMARYAEHILTNYEFHQLGATPSAPCPLPSDN